MIDLRYDVPPMTPVQIVSGHTYYGDKPDHEIIVKEYPHHFLIRAIWGELQKPYVVREYSIMKASTYCGDAVIRRLDTGADIRHRPLPAAVAI